MLQSNTNSQNTLGANQLPGNPLPNNGINTNTMLLIIIAVLLTAIVAGGGMYLYLTSPKGDQTQPGPQPTIAPLKSEKTIPTPTQAAQITVAPTATPTSALKPSGLLYDNTEFGFTLTFPETWKGFVYNKKMIDFGGGTTAPVIYFGLPAQTDIFAIGIYTKAQWQTLQASEGPKDQYLGENTTTVFGYSLGQYAANDEMATRRSEVGNFIKTFKTQ